MTENKISHSEAVAAGAVAVDVGSVHTRASLFDLVDGKYRFIGTGIAQSSLTGTPDSILDGVKGTLQQLQALTEKEIVLPEGTDPSPAEMGQPGNLFTMTISGGPSLRILLVGLQENESLRSLRTLADSLGMRSVESISLNDGRKPEEHMEITLGTCPDLILIAGGTEDGASRAMLGLLESVALACSFFPDETKPVILFAGNSAIRADVQALFTGNSEFHITENIHPAHNQENLDSAIEKAAGLVAQLKVRRSNGLDNISRGVLEKGGQNSLLTTPAAFGRIIRFLSRARQSDGKASLKKGVLGIDIGASTTTIAAAFQGKLTLGVYPELGLAQALNGLLDHLPFDRLLRWIQTPIPESLVREYLLHRSINPGNIPYSLEEMAIEQGVARMLMQKAVERLSMHFNRIHMAVDMISGFEPVLASGSVLTGSIALEQTMLMLLDGLQPAGITTMILDQHHIAAALGSIAPVNPAVTVQVLESSAFLHLGTVISPVGRARPGTPVLRIKVSDDNKYEQSFEVLQGSLVVLPLASGQPARLYIQPLQRFDVGMGGPGIGGNLRVIGGEFGVVIDSRGRPCSPPVDPYQGQEWFQQWLSVLRSKDLPGQLQQSRRESSTERRDMP